MKKIILILSILIFAAFLQAKYISAYSAFSSVNVADDDVLILEDTSADSTGEYHKITFSSLAAYVLGGAEIGGSSAGDIVTLDDTQTLTDKTLTEADINNMDADGGSFDGGTLGTNSDILELEVDNLNVNGNSIISDTGDITLNPADYVTIPTGEFKYAGTAVAATGLEMNLLDAGSNEAVYDNGTTVAVKANGDHQLSFTDGAVIPGVDNDVNLGASGTEFKDGYFDGTLYADAIDFNGTAIIAKAEEINFLDDVASQVAGLDEGLAMNIHSITNNYSITESGIFLVNSTSNTVGMELPAISRTKAYRIIVVIESGGNNVTIEADGSDAGMVVDGTLHDQAAISSTAKHCIIFESSGFPTGYWFVLSYYGFALD